MGLLTVLEMETECRYILGGDEDEDSARIRRWLKFGYEFLCAPNIYEHPELETAEIIPLVAGNSQTTTTVWNKIEVVRFFDTAIAGLTNSSIGRRLRPTSIRRLNDRSQQVEGQPTRYAYYTNVLILDKIIAGSDVGKILMVFGRTRAPTINWANDAAVTTLREEWDQLIIMAGAMNGFNAKGLYEKAHGIRDSIGRLVNDMPQVQDMTADDWEDEMSVTGTYGSQRRR